ncbi:MAG: hypothetical protein H6552_00410 [Chitinophagales bacterium]|nr:hypothetical protein [Chitinophagales bacterium]
MAKKKEEEVIEKYAGTKEYKIISNGLYIKKGSMKKLTYEMALIFKSKELI